MGVIIIMTEQEIARLKEIKEEIKDVDAMTAYMQAYREKKYRYYNQDAYILEKKAKKLYCITKYIYREYPDVDSVEKLHQYVAILPNLLERLREIGELTGVINYRNSYTSSIGMYTKLEIPKPTEEEMQAGLELLKKKIVEYGGNKILVIKWLLEEQHSMVKKINTFIMHSEEEKELKRELKARNKDLQLNSLYA